MKVGSVRVVSWAVFLWLVMAPCYLFAQEGSLHGRVTDPSGAVIPGAAVTAAPAAGPAARAVTDAQGNYEIKGLAAGSYSVNAEANGFSKSNAQTISLAAGQAK